MADSRELQKSLWQHPIWLAGFRPFFILAMISGALLPLWWGLVFSGRLPAVTQGLNPLQWHAHEMLFGFGWAVMGGFLLTASKNWVKIRGLHGGPLALAVLFWLIERVSILCYGVLPGGVREVASNAFIIFVSGYILWSLIYYHRQDSFRDNIFFVIALPLFVIAKNMILNPEWYALGWPMALGLFRVAFVVMFERTLTQFMKNSMGIMILRNPWLDYSIKVFALLAVFAGFFPPVMAAGVLGVTGGLLGLRWLLWKPQKAFKNFGIAISYFGYLALTVHFICEALGKIMPLHVVGSLSIHIFTFLCMGLVIPAMFIRICQGHTGRKLLFTTSDRLALGFMGMAAFFRLVATQLWPQNYTDWIILSGVGWTLCFALIGYRLIPFLVKARIDGREH